MVSLYKVWHPLSQFTIHPLVSTRTQCYGGHLQTMQCVHKWEAARDMEENQWRLKDTTVKGPERLKNWTFLLSGDTTNYRKTVPPSQLTSKLHSNHGHKVSRTLMRHSLGQQLGETALCVKPIKRRRSNEPAPSGFCVNNWSGLIGESIGMPLVCL